jgi:hypothetical protein
VEEPAAGRLIRGLARRDELECHFAAERGILGEVDLTHPTLADAGQRVIAGDFCADHARDRLIVCGLSRRVNVPADASAATNGPGTDREIERS